MMLVSLRLRGWGLVKKELRSVGEACVVWMSRESLCSLRVSLASGQGESRYEKVWGLDSPSPSCVTTSPGRLCRLDVGLVNSVECPILLNGVKQMIYPDQSVGVNPGHLLWCLRHSKVVLVGWNL